ncbi:hypothetical protein [Nocardia brasiliensis]|uniref:hypothetical protein n=1 Tax=Nocardia brasiliensis TaxID=37326 RepID=UPI0024581044|nr:hypothetical protein [Nocardia brasiliensis]
MAKFDLLGRSREFADTLNDLLNGTVCRGIHLQPAVDKRTGSVIISYRPNREDLGDIVGIPFCPTGKPKVHLGLSVRLRPDRSNLFLMVVSSAMILALDSALEKTLLHYDYERDKPLYPEAHVQVCASSDHWEELLGDRPLKRLHLPVGGRRFRPTLEDVVEFVIAEKILPGLPGWEGVIEESRRAFQMRQLRAAIRNHPDVAQEELSRISREEPAPDERGSAG